MDRINKLTAHFQQQQQQVNNEGEQLRPINFVGLEGVAQRDKLMDLVPDVGTPWELEYEGLHKLPGPHRKNSCFYRPTKKATIQALNEQRVKGKDVMSAERMALEFTNGRTTSINMVIPSMFMLKKPIIGDLVIIGNAKDAERLAHVHLVKSLQYGDQSFLGDGVLSTRNLENWRDQRRHLMEAFLIEKSISKIMPVSVKRAIYAIDLKIKDDGNKIDMLEFFSFEAMTQLHMALFGESQEFSEANNVKLRKSFNVQFSGLATSTKEEIVEAVRFTREFSQQVLNHSVDSQGRLAKAAPSHAEKLNCPVLGPLAAKLVENPAGFANEPLIARRDSVSTFSFAGFDTTANLMTWLTFEMCRNPHYQERLQKEIDSHFETVMKPQNRAELIYSDFKNFPFLTRCITETLRLWTSVPSGTFRETVVPETIEGENGEKVFLPEGTQIQIASYLLHRSEELWGKDVLMFNPDRAFLPDEIWEEKGFAARNPSSYRYAPFTFPQRGCIGLNFAQMESRTILIYLFRKFSFALAEPTKSRAVGAEKVETFLGFNFGTMAPDGGMWVYAKKRF